MSGGGQDPTREGEGHTMEESKTEGVANAFGDEAGALGEAEGETSATVQEGIEEHPKVKVSKSILY